jgi:hypothetical protein
MTFGGVDRVVDAAPVRGPLAATDARRIRPLFRVLRF